MSYTKQNWQSGDTITATKLNHMEDGIANGGGVLFINIENNDNSYVMDKTWQQIYDAPFAVARFGSPVSVWAVTAVEESQGVYGVALVSLESAASGMVFTTNSADGYPSAPK